MPLINGHLYTICIITFFCSFSPFYVFGPLTLATHWLSEVSYKTKIWMRTLQHNLWRI